MSITFTFRNSSILRHAVCVVAILLVALFLYGTLIDRHGFYSHESVSLYMRVEQMAEQVRAGNIPPLVFADAVYGRDMPFLSSIRPSPIRLRSCLRYLQATLCSG
jgi:hypothetical protein